MAAYESKYPGLLILPGGKVINEGDTVDLADELLSNDAVKGWIEQDWLVETTPKTKKRQGLEKNAEKHGVAFTDETTDDDLAEVIKAVKASS